MSYFFAAKRNTRGQCRQLKTAKVTRVTNSRINIGYDERHRVAPTPELHSSLAHDIGHVVRTHCPMQWKSWKVMPDEIKTETNYNLEDLNDESLAYVNRLFSDRRVTRRSLRGGRIVERGSTLIFRIKPKSIRAIGRRRLFSTIQVLGPSLIGWMHGSGGGPNSQRSTSLATFMFGLGMSWPSPFM
ncbi:unnamed protein product [Prunus armeniaca]